MPETQEELVRELPEIEKEYAELCSKAGRCHYQIEVFKSELNMTTDRINRVNIEASKRRQLTQQQEAAKNAVTQ